VRRCDARHLAVKRIVREKRSGMDANATAPSPPLPLPGAAGNEGEDVRDVTTDLADPVAPAEGTVGREEGVDDDFFDVVVTSVEHSSDAAAGASVTHAIASSLSSAGAYTGYTVELVVTRGVSSYCIRRPLPLLFELLRALDAGAPQQKEAASADDSGTEAGRIPEFPAKGNASDAMIAQWCGSMTAFLAGAFCHPSMYGWVMVRLTDRSCPSSQGRCGYLRDQPEWMVFVEEASVVHGNRSQMTAIEFILQPFPNEKVAVLALASLPPRNWSRF
jgi:hypothetical protein